MSVKKIVVKMNKIILCINFINFIFYDSISFFLYLNIRV